MSASSDDHRPDHGSSPSAVSDRAPARSYAVAVTPHLEALMASSPAVARQFRPDPVAESARAPGERADPIGDEAHAPVKGIVHRYPDRVLLTPHFSCPAYCRFCFRREKVGRPGQSLSAADLDAAIAYVAGHPEIWEVILSGGDPLALPPGRLGGLVRRLSAIGHVGVIRVHTRVPVTDPRRITPELVAALVPPAETADAAAETADAGAETAVWVVIHCNHPDELTPPMREACRRLRAAGLSLLGQTVLLRGVNDDVAVLETLFRALVRQHIKPYYLHHGDLAPGTGHFRTSLDEGRAIVRALRGRLSGIGQPTYVLDIPGGYGKVPVGPCHLHRDETGRTLIEDIAGRLHAYDGE